jgi:hypothetical protein
MMIAVVFLLVIATLVQGRPQFIVHSNDPGNELGYRLGNGLGNKLGNGILPQNNFGHYQARRVVNFGRFGGFGNEDFSGGFRPVIVTGYPSGIVGSPVGLNGYPNEVDRIENNNFGLEGFGFGSNDHLSYLDFLLTRLSYKIPEQ